MGKQRGAQPRADGQKPDTRRWRLGRAGERVIRLLRRLLGKLRLQINEEKSAVASVFNRQFLGFSLWVAPGKIVKHRVSRKALGSIKTRVRQLTRRNRGRSLSQIASDLRGYLMGWKGYFRLAETPRVFRELDEWIRHRLRTIQLKQWRRGKTIYRELMARGTQRWIALKVAANSRRWWKNFAKSLNHALPNKLFDELGVPRLAT